MTLVAQEYLAKIKAIEDERERLRQESKRLWREYMAYLKRQNDPQTNLEDCIREKELREKK